MDLKSQRQLAARVLKCGRTRVWLDPARTADIADAITANDIKRLIKDGVIAALPKKGASNYRRKKVSEQKKKGRRKNTGSRRGKLGTRAGGKRQWIRKIRAIRAALKELRSAGQIEKAAYRQLYRQSKSGFFRSRSHLAGYIEKNKLLSERKKE